MIKKKAIGFIVGFVGFVSAIVGLWPYVFPPKKDSEVMLVDENMPEIILNSNTEPLDEEIISASTIIIDGIDYEFPSGMVMVTNKLIMQNGGSIKGDDISILSTIISGGAINAKELENLNGGSILIASAQVNGTAIDATGGHGSNGPDGVNGKNGAQGKNGRRGNCDGFGAWRAAAGGARGGDGGNGTPGVDGQSGGDGGKISIYHSSALTNEPTASQGKGGLGGKGGKGGSAGSGGAGGRGCTGIGGTQSNAPNGRAGAAGTDGIDGKNANSGNAGNISMRNISFRAVQEIVNKESELDEIRLKLQNVPLKE